ncbi:phage regulatory CII family protein [Pseudorhodoplanes sp.]|uniref:phage regulatory CII family protein n=1 Tax=Pseudorhodoplanes sp. TaxID=1934341 RepID=UPI002D003FC5|nr:phage regulatory CII family protein [Pseudorhodoplanes sp.]HWV44088.1 phage regulatory CII family protein [Pseudorhodoplanes sp.]
MNGRPFSRADYLAIKSATRRACEAAGPLSEIASHTRVDAPILSRYGNPEESVFIPLDVAMDLDALSGGARILKAYAAALGYELVRAERGKATEDLYQHVGDIGKASGNLLSEMCEAKSDGAVTPAEAERIDRKADEVEDKVAHLRADMRRVQARGQ